MIGGLAICVVIALAAWALWRAYDGARDGLAFWELSEEELPVGKGPTSTIVGDDPYVPVAPGDEVPPEDAALSDEQIRAAYDTAFDESATPEQWLAAVDAPVEVGERLKTLAAGCGAARVSVGRVAFRSPQEAAVEFHFRGSPIAGGDAIRFGGGAVRVEGTWRVTGWTIDEVIDTAAPFCQ